MSVVVELADERATIVERRDLKIAVLVSERGPAGNLESGLL